MAYTGDGKARVADLLRKWVGWGVVLPLVFVGALYWPVGFLWLPPENLFERVFASSELLPLTALILIGVAAEIEHSALFDAVRTNALENFRHGSQLVAVLFLFFYGVFKVKYLQYTFPDEAGSVDGKITWLAYASVSLAFAGVALAVAAKVTAARSFLASRSTAGGR